MVLSSVRERYLCIGRSRAARVKAGIGSRPRSGSAARGGDRKGGAEVAPSGAQPSHLAVALSLSLLPTYSTLDRTRWLAVIHTSPLPSLNSCTRSSPNCRTSRLRTLISRTKSAVASTAPSTHPSPSADTRSSPCLHQQLESLALPPTSPLSLTGVSAAASAVPPLKNGTLSSPPTTPFVKAADIGAPSWSASAVPVSPSLPARAEAAAKGYSSRVVLTTYPGQVGIHPIPLRWGAPTPEERGPVVASRQPNSLKVRNAIGAYSGSYSIYRAIAAAAGQIDPSHRPGVCPSP